MTTQHVIRPHHLSIIFGSYLIFHFYLSNETPAHASFPSLRLFQTDTHVPPNTRPVGAPFPPPPKHSRVPLPKGGGMERCVQSYLAKGPLQNIGSLFP